MKKLIFILSMFLSITLSIAMSHSAFATVDSHAKVFLVVEDVQTNDFFVERAPIIACYGSANGPRLAQLTTEYKVNSNIGCGGKIFKDNINYLVCAKIKSSKESADGNSLSELTLDISNCEAKENPQFITMLRTAVKLNFPLKTGEIKLNLIK